MESRMRMTATKISLPDGREFLVVDIAIACPYCGDHTVQFAGHHLRAIRDGLIEMIDLHPGLTGRDEDIQTSERSQFGGVVDDPTKN